MKKIYNKESDLDQLQLLVCITQKMYDTLVPPGRQPANKDWKASKTSQLQQFVWCVEIAANRNI